MKSQVLYVSYPLPAAVQISLKEGGIDGYDTDIQMVPDQETAFRLQEVIAKDYGFDDDSVFDVKPGWLH